MFCFARYRIHRYALSLLALATALSAATTASAGPARFLKFSAGVSGEEVVLLANQTPMMRLEKGLIPLTALQHVADNLNSLALRGVHAGQVEAKAGDPGTGCAQLLVAGCSVLTVDSPLAAAKQTTPLGLTQSWAQNLKHALSGPYLTISPLDKLTVPLGEKRPLRWGGTASADLSFTSQDTSIAKVQLDASGGSLQVEGCGMGSTQVTAALGARQLSVEIEVKAWAARTQPNAVAEVTAPPLPADDLRRTLRNAALAATRPAAGATVELGEPVRSGNGYVLQLHASGRGCFDVDEAVPVGVRTVEAPRVRARELLVSNAPERITEPATLLRERLVGGIPVRLLWHHVNSSGRPLRFVVRVANLGDRETRVHVTEAAMGPNEDEIYAGHSAMARFVALSAQGEGYYLKVPGVKVLDLYDVSLTADRIVSGLATLTPDPGAPLLLEVVAEDVWPNDAWFQAVSARLNGDPPLTPYRFEASKTVELEHTVGGAWAFYHIGKDFSVNLQGQKLYGDYGVEYTIKATFKNPTQQPARCEIGLRASGGVARSTLVLNGELLETGLLRGANEQLIYKQELQPGEQKSVSLVTTPESGSNYPITLTMRSWQ